MQNYFIAVLIALSTMPVQVVVESPMNKQTLAVKLRCTNNPDCIFTGSDIRIDITIKNTKTVEIGYPLEYIDQRGPTLTLTDTLTRKKLPLKTQLADRALMGKFTKIGPGDSIKMTTIIKSGEITSFRHDFVDVVLEVGVSAKIQMNNSPKTPDYSALGKIHIYGSDTLMRDEQRQSN